MRQSKAREVKRTNSKETPSKVISTSIDASGERLVCAHANGNITLWRCKTSTEWEQTTCFETPHAEHAITEVVFAPARLHPCLVATAGNDGLIVLLAVSSQNDGHAIHTILQSRGAAPISSIAFSEAGLLATRCGAVVNLYQCDSAHTHGIHVDAFKWRHISDVYVDDAGGSGISFAPGGAFFVTGGCIARRLQGGCSWDVVTSFATADIAAPSLRTVRCVHWGSAGYLALATEGARVMIWQLKLGDLRLLADMSVERSVSRVQWDRNGTTLAVIDEKGFTSTFSRRLDGGAWQWAREHENLKHVPAS